jgi:hypothetical protein
MKRVAAFAALLVLVGAAAAGLGAVTRGEPPAGAPMADEHMGAVSPGEEQQSSGLATSAGGFTFVPERVDLPRGPSRFGFHILDANGAPTHDFTEDGGVRLHLIVVRRDFTGYTHVHPARQRDGSWAVPLELREAGVYRAYVDFERDGEKTVLGHDLFVAGAMQRQALPAAATHSAVDGYEVTLAKPTLHAGEEGDLRFTVSRGGVPVPHFDSYVGMRGHLIALHDGDLAYSHVHALETDAPGVVEFRTELHAAGAYRLFFQFKLAGRVVTAPFTVEVQR